MAASGSDRSAALIVLSAALGALALTVPFALRAPRPAGEVEAAERRETGFDPRGLDLKRRRWAYPGNCGVGDFKDRRSIEDDIRQGLRMRSVRGVRVVVGDDCVATLSGLVRDVEERGRAVQAASHPFIRRIRTEALRQGGSAAPRGCAPNPSPAKR